MKTNLVPVVMVVTCATIFYFIPSIAAMKKTNFLAIFMLNLFLGWTFIGWVIALVWACTVDHPSSRQ
ncbi:MAG TPA: superinfection immunity protein [bacterium]